MAINVSFNPLFSNSMKHEIFNNSKTFYMSNYHTNKSEDELTGVSLYDKDCGRNVIRQYVVAYANFSKDKQSKKMFTYNGSRGGGKRTFEQAVKMASDWREIAKSQIREVNCNLYALSIGKNPSYSVTPPLTQNIVSAVKGMVTMPKSEWNNYVKLVKAQHKIIMEKMSSK